MKRPEAPKVVLIRHGETEWSRDGRHTGRTDIPLTAVGEVQARRLRPRLETWRFDAVFVSPLQRARRTCALAGYDDVATVDPDLQEWDYGDYEGLTGAQIRSEQAGWLIWKHGVRNGETAEQVGRRADAVIARVRAAGGNVALFAHGHLLRILTARWCDMVVVDAEHLFLAAAAISVIGHDRESPVIWKWNDSAHLDRETGW